MTDHSTEELRKQLEVATSQAANAIHARDEARKRLDAKLISEKEKELQAIGVTFGKTVVDVFDRGRHKGRFGILGAKKVSWLEGAYPIFCRLKIDGTPGRKAVSWVLFDEIRVAEDQPDE